MLVELLSRLFKSFSGSVPTISQSIISNKPTNGPRQSTVRPVAEQAPTKKAGVENFGARILATNILYQMINAARERVDSNKQAEEEVVYEGNITNNKSIAVLIEALKTMTSYERLLIAGFEEMEKRNFSETSSVDSKFTIDKSKETRFDYLNKKVDLMQHTLNVVAAAINYKNVDIQSYEKDILILLALFHDFGKNKNVKDEVETRFKQTGFNYVGFEHEQFGAYFMFYLFLRLYPNESELAEKLRDIIFRQHEKSLSVLTGVDTRLLQLLREVDAQAREAETEEWSKGNNYV